MLTRRTMLRIGGLMLAAPALSARPAFAVGPVEIIMHGNANGSEVWYDPIGLLVEPGAELRWTNRDAGNAHTATAYHPANGGHPLRIPTGAEPWDSSFLLPDQAFSVRLVVPGVYDFFCMPHEMAGMVGRIVVGIPADLAEPYDDGLVMEAARGRFPAVAEIIAAGVVRR